MNGNDAWSAVAELAASQHGAFHRTQAAENGIDAQRLRRGVRASRVRQVLSDVFVFESAAATWEQRLVVASLVGGVASHASAAALHGLAGFERAGDTIEVCFPRRTERSLPNAIVHTWSYTSNQKDITEVDGIRCTSIARTLVQLGATCSRSEVEQALDSALAQKVSPRWIEETWQRLRRPGPTGANVLEDIMYDPARSGAVSESVLERLVEQAIAGQGLPRAVRQHVVHLPSGERRLDLAFPEAQLAIEAHSRRFHFGPGNEERDNNRDFELAAAGWEVLYVTWGMAHQPEFFVEHLRQTYYQRIRLLRAS